jgi:hypothetical protein
MLISENGLSSPQLSSSSAPKGDIAELRSLAEEATI